MQNPFSKGLYKGTIKCIKIGGMIFSHLMVTLILASIFTLVALAFASSLKAESVSEIVKTRPTGFVSDFAGLLSAEQKASIENSIQAHKDLTGGANGGDEIAVVTIKTLDGDSLENFANNLFRGWGIGSKEKNNGVLLLVALQERKIRIEVGYGLEGTLTDLQTFKISDGIMKPIFRESKYGEGIEQAVQTIIQTIQGDTARLDALESSPSTGTSKGFLGMISSSPDAFFTFLFFLFGFVFPILGSVLGRSKSWWGGGILGTIVGLIIGWVFAAGFFILVYAIGYAVLGLIFDYIVSKKYKEGGKGRDKNGFGGWFYGGGGFGSGGHGGSSGGFGGFSGGSSGGGGSSSGW